MPPPNRAIPPPPIEIGEWASVRRRRHPNVDIRGAREVRPLGAIGEPLALLISGEVEMTATGVEPELNAGHPC